MKKAPLRELFSVDIFNDIFGRNVKTPRVIEEGFPEFKGFCVVKAVADSFVKCELYVHILVLINGSVGVNFIASSLCAESNEGGASAKIVEMVIYGGDAERAH